MVCCEDKYLGCFILQYIKTRMRADHDQKIALRKAKKKGLQNWETAQQITNVQQPQPTTLQIEAPPAKSNCTDRRKLKKRRLDGDSHRGKLKSHIQ